jgi:hypothetical protein
MRATLHEPWRAFCAFIQAEDPKAVNELHEKSVSIQPRPNEADEPAASAVAGKKPFVEPAVSVPSDVLEATSMFQAPTVQTSVVPTLAP